LYVFFLSLSLELPRFFEFKLVERDGRWFFWTTELMEKPEYIRLVKRKKGEGKGKCRGER